MSDKNKEEFETGRQIAGVADGLSQVVKLRMRPQVYAYLRAHAYERRISTNLLINDLLQCWVASITDETDSAFAPAQMGFRLPTLPPERYAGYVASLGFDPETLANDQAPALAGDRIWKE